MYHLIVFGPLVGFLLAGLFGKQLGDRGSQIVTSGLLVISAIASMFAFYDVVVNGNVQTITVMEWVRSGSLDFNWAFKIDTLTAVMLVVVNFVSALIHIYSVGYMSHDPHNPRFFAYLSLFTFSMLMLVTADNLVQMFFGWEGVGLTSYLLIGFWYERPAANAAAIKAFIVNRIGDFGFALGIFAIFMVFGTVYFDAIFAAVPDYVGQTFNFLGWQVDIITTIAILLFIGAMGKSAQLGLHTWLPDAMEGPTPVSALIHAATMVTAGVFLVARMSPLFEFSPVALMVVAIVGAATAFFAATIGLVQNDIKRVIAYSTMSQLGYMFFALGLSAYGAAIFHLFTHAFFKALLFLGSGSVIHAMSDEQDMRKMGGLRKMIPLTWGLMIIGTLALTGFPLTAGYFSKDMILEVAFVSDSPTANFAWWAGILAALMTAFYSWRLIFMTFHGKPRASKEVMDNVHESPMVMILPLVVLGLGALFAGLLFSNMFTGDGYNGFWNGALFLIGENVMEEAHHLSWGNIAGKWLPTIMMVGGLSLAYLFYIKRTDLPAKAASAFKPLYLFFYNKWYFDELYDFLFVKPAFKIGRFFWKFGDGRIIDGLGPDGVSSTVQKVAGRVRKIQTGYIYHYAFAMLIGVAALVTYFMFFRGVL
ncbi:MAG: NADH-quinone oxidoreductase subunit L [Sphingomonadales bacterium]